MVTEYKCAVCSGMFNGHGNNAEPLAHGKACDKCNLKVITERLKLYQEDKARSKK